MRPRAYRNLDTICRCAVLLLCVLAHSGSAYALRVNTIRDLDQLEQMGHYEDVLYYRVSSRDMVRALHAALAGIPFDPRMDAVYANLNRIFGNGQGPQNQGVETRIDRRFWNIISGQEPVITRLLAKANLTDAQRARLKERVRVYVENHLSPEFDEMGNFFFLSKARIFEQSGLFWDASFRRHLTGYYDLRVCVPYYATISEELSQSGQTPLASAYRDKSEWFRSQALCEFRRSNGDRLLSDLRAQKQRRLDRPELVALLKQALASADPDTRFAAVLTLADLNEMDALLPTTADADVEIRCQIARAFARTRFAAGQARLAQDRDPAVRAILAEALKPLPAGFRPGVLAEYFDQPDQARPIAAATLRTVNIGFRGNERFPDVLRPFWPNETVFPAGAAGQFLLKLRGSLNVPADGTYRFYLKTESDNRAVLRLADSAGKLLTLISPANDSKLLFADQREAGGNVLHRVDFSEPFQLKSGIIDLEIDYKGAQVQTPFGKSGLRLYWSSDHRVMEPVPENVLFHRGE